MTSLMNTPRLGRACAATATLALALALALTACGDDEGDSQGSDGNGGSADATVLTSDELEPAVLSTDDLPGGFVETPVEEDDNEETGLEDSCLGEVGALDDDPGFEAEEKAKKEFTLDGDAGQGTVSASLQSYTDTESVTDAIDLFLETIESCTDVEATDVNGLEYDLSVASDDSVTVDDVDAQVRIDLTGTITNQGVPFDVAFAFVVIRTDNNLAAVGTSEFGDVDGVVDQTEDLMATQVGKLSDLAG